MASTPPAGYGNATLIWDHAGDPDPYTVDLGFQEDGTTTPLAQATTISNAWTGGFGSAANTISGYTFRGVEVIRNRSGVVSDGVYTANVAGTYAVNAASSNVALLVKKSSTIVGRRNRGRSFLPPCYVDKNGIDSNGVILAATLTTLNTRLATFLGALTTALLPMVILHSDGVGAPTPVVSYVMESVVATQRRRLR